MAKGIQEIKGQAKLAEMRARKKKHNYKEGGTKIDSVPVVERWMEILKNLE